MHLTSAPFPYAVCLSRTIASIASTTSSQATTFDEIRPGEDRALGKARPVGEHVVVAQREELRSPADRRAVAGVDLEVIAVAQERPLAGVGTDVVRQPAAVAGAGIREAR